MTLPHPKQVRDVLTDLLGRQVSLAPIDVWMPGLTEPCWIGELTDDDGTLLAAVLLDLPSTVNLGAAIGLMPADLAAELVAESAPSELVMSNTQEVLNVFASIFNCDANPHSRLRGLLPVGSELSPELLGLIRSTGNRDDFEVTIAGYGAGRIGLLCR